jgi:hypothetical protein
MVKKQPTISSLEEELIFNQQSMGIGSAVNSSRRRVPSENSTENSDNKSPEEKINELVEKSSHVLFSMQTVFPFDFFPDTLTINANKIDVVKTSFFASHQTSSIPLRDIANVEIQTSPFFATLRITNIRYPMHPKVLRFLKKHEAMKAKNIIDGLLVAISQGADITNIEPTKLIEEMEKVGNSATEE